MVDRDREDQGWDIDERMREGAGPGMAGRRTDTAISEADRLLVDAVLAGDKDAFRALVERESATILGVCRRILSDPSEAEDAAQDAFLVAYRKLGSFRGDGPLGGWLMRIAIREAHRRSQRRRPMMSLEPERASDSSTQTLGSSPDPATILEVDERQRSLQAAVDGLPDRYRDAVRLRYLADLSYDEIAAITGRPPATIRTHLHRGLLRLRGRLSTEPWS